MWRVIGMSVAVLFSSSVLADNFYVDPALGKSTLSAEFNAKLGERIVAQSSSVECDATHDQKSGTLSGKCSVPLTSLRVDNHDLKTEHFWQWVTNAKADPKTCKFET